MDDAALSALLQRQEELLLAPEIRSSADHLREWLTEDFVEFGSSGRVFNRESIVRLLAQEDSQTSSVPHLLDVALIRIAPGAALLTYRLQSIDNVSLRSSLWVAVGSQWRMRFHQGTRIGERAAST